MDKETTFIYNYSASANREVQEIRKKYLPKEESKIEELKRLDNEVQEAGVLMSLILGISGGLVFGLGLCMAMDVIDGGMVMGVLIGIIGTAGMVAAYPVGRRIQFKKKAELTPRILQLTEELTGEK